MTDLWPGLGRSSPQPLRIGDAERDQAVSALAEHFAAGRLNRDEYDDRAELALQARFRDDLARLFIDLPGPADRPRQGQAPRTPAISMASGLMMTLPLLTLGLIITALAIGAPWMLFGVFWFVMLGGFGFRRFGGQHHHHGHLHGHRQYGHHHQRGRTLGA